MTLSPKLQRNLDVFNKSLTRFASVQVPIKALLLQKKVCLQILNGVVVKTPVRVAIGDAPSLGGTARGGWQVDIGGYAPADTERDLSPNGRDTQTKGNATISALSFGQPCTIANAVHYVPHLEDGSSRQAPKGMLSITLREVEAQFR